MRPNIEEKSNILIRFNCSDNSHYLDIAVVDEDEKTLAIMVFVDSPTSFWKYLSNWWRRHRGCYVTDIILSRHDIERVVENLQRFLEK